MLVNASGGNVVCLRGRSVQKALVVAQVKVGLGTVLGDVALSVLIGIQRTRINIEVGVKLLNGHRITTCLQELGQG